MSQIAAQVILESAREMFGSVPWREPGAGKAVGEAAGKARDKIRDLKDVSTLLDRLEDTYGPNGAHGLTQRFGKAVFRVGLKQLGGQAGFRAMEYRTLPSPRRVEVGLEALARMISATTGDEITVAEDGTHWYVRVPNCTECRGRTAAGPACFAMVGMIQEFAAWASGGRFYRVIETECSAAGAPACVFRIDKTPLD
jgi:predicted hydrocarbon binding protein